jgi:hypothetical protein
MKSSPSDLRTFRKIGAEIRREHLSACVSPLVAEEGGLCGEVKKGPGESPNRCPPSFFALMLG